MNSKKHNWKSKIEKSFASLGYAMGRHPYVWLIACTVLVAAIATQLVHLRQDTSIEGFLKKGDPAIVRYDRFKELFGRDEVFLVSLEVDDIFNQTFIDQFRAFHEEIATEVPHVKKVESLINARYTYGANDTLYIEEILPDTLTNDPAEVEKLKAYTFNNENYLDYLISRDHKLLAIAVRLDSYLYEKDENGEIQELYLEESDMQDSLHKLYEIIDKYQGVLSDDIRLAGSMPISLLLGAILEHDFTVFTGLANFLIAIVLWIIFRRLSGVVMPLFIMTLGIVMTLSAMALMDTPMQISTSILPSFLLAVCVGDSIHLLTMFYRHYDSGEDKIHALALAMEHTGLAIFFTSITTAAGLASFSTSEITPISSLGTYGALGSLIAFLLTILILPCLISVLPLKRRPLSPHHKKKGLEPVLQWCATVSIRYAKPIVGVSMIVFVLAAAIASQSNFSHHPVTWMPDDAPAMLALKKHENRMGPSLAIEVVLDTGKERGVTNAEFVTTLNQIQQEVEQWDNERYQVIKTMSIANIIKESNRALHDNDETHYSIPNDSNLISQELLLVELDEPDDLYSMIDRNYQIARLTLLIPWVDAIYARELVERLKPYLREKLGRYTTDISTTGVTSVLGSTFAQMLYSTAESYGIAAIAITLMMIFLIGSFKLGLVSMIPSLLPILIVLAILHLANIPLDMLTLLIGSIAIGLTVDDNVHFMHGFRRLYVKTGDPAYAAEQTLLSTGRAMLITSIVLSIGFIVYTQSEMKNMITFGFMTAACIILALFATFMLAPALMMLTNKTWHTHPAKITPPRGDFVDDSNTRDKEPKVGVETVG